MWRVMIILYKKDNFYTKSVFIMIFIKNIYGKLIHSVKNINNFAIYYIVKIML